MLEPIQKEAIKKMSTERVTTKLRKLCYTDEELNTLTRDDLLDRWAEAVLTGEDKATIVSVSAAAVTSKVSDEVERERIEWEKYKWSEEIKEKRLQREADIEEKNCREKLILRRKGCREKQKLYKSKRVSYKRKINCTE